MVSSFCHKLLVVAVIAVLAAGIVSAELRLITIDQAPYIVRIKSIYGEHLCGGTLVGPRYVVTAAHCFDLHNNYELRIVAGATTLSDSGVQRRIDKAFIHPDYKIDYLRMDVAVIRLDKDMPLGGANISTVELCNSNKSLGVGDVIQVSGWGKTSDDSKTASKQLHTADVELMSKDICVQQHLQLKSEELPFTEEVFGAAICSKPGATDACRGDSGGPGINGGELCAVVSGGMGCSDSHMPGLYTSINLVKDFIESAMKK